MEEKKKNSKSLIIFLVLVIIVLGGFIAYDKLLLKDNKTTTNMESNETLKNNEQKKDEAIKTSNEKYQVLSLSPIGGHAVLYEGEVYVNIYDSTPNIDDVYGDGVYQNLIQTRNGYKEYSFGYLEVKIDNLTKSKWMKLNVDNIKSISNNEYGQALSSTNPKYGIILINNDSTVSFVRILDLIKGNSNIEKLSISNVSEIKTEDNGGYTTYIITNDGTKTNVNELIK